MKTSAEIDPSKITKPIQLLAAWLAGLSIINASFLAAAKYVNEPTWLPALLCIAAVANVPIFIISLFLLQTKFRPEMQEDSYYSRYLENKYSKLDSSFIERDTEKEREELANAIVNKLSSEVPNKSEEVQKLLKESQIEDLSIIFGNSRTLSELYLHKDEWPIIHNMYREQGGFQEDIAALGAAKIAEFPAGRVSEAKLTKLGREVAEHLRLGGRLWNQIDGHESRHEEDMERSI